MRRLIIYVLASAFLCGVAGATSFKPKSAIVENESLRIVFDKQNGALISFLDKTNWHEHIDGQHLIPVWTAAFTDGTAFSSSSAKSFRARPSNATQVSFVWSDFGMPNHPDVMVTAIVSLEEHSPASHWRLMVDGLRGMQLGAVHYPRIGPIAKQEHETLAVPQWLGERAENVRDLVNTGSNGRLEWDYPGELSFQCIALYGGKGIGISIASYDPQSAHKQFAVFGDGQGGLNAETILDTWPTQVPKPEWGTAYPVVVRTFTGDWYTAAAQYREWAKEQAWAKEARRAKNETPPWVLDTGLWIWNRGKSPGVLGPAKVLQEHAGIPVSVFWHWWHGCAYDTGFPEYFPPREGEEPFRKAVADAQHDGIHAIVYMNQRLWGMNTESWKTEDAEKYAVKNRDGAVAQAVYNTFTKALCASMCIETKFWRNKYATLATKAVTDLGVDGVYMDQACSCLPCYDVTHQHTRGWDGERWVENFHDLTTDIRKRCEATKSVALAGEGCGEAWLPYLDLMLCLQVSRERYMTPGAWEPIPFFTAVYHDSAVQFGNYSSLTRPPYDELWPAEFAPAKPLELLDRKYAAQFCLEQARAFVWGQQPTLANFMPDQLTERAEEIDFVLRLARLRSKAAKFLRDGVFLRPPDIDPHAAEIPMSRLSIYAGQQGAVKEFSKLEPSVLASAWQAKDGSMAVAVVNGGDKAVSEKIEMAHADYPMPKSVLIRRIDREGEKEVARVGDGDIAVYVQLGPRDAAVYTIVVL